MDARMNCNNARLHCTNAGMNRNKTGLHRTNADEHRNKADRFPALFDKRGRDAKVWRYDAAMKRHESGHNFIFSNYETEKNYRCSYREPKGGQRNCCRPLTKDVVCLTLIFFTMPKEHVLLDFIRYPVIEKISFCDTVHDRMTDNPFFLTPDVLMTTLKTKNDALRAAYGAAQKGGREETVLMHQAEDEWDDMMRKEAAYVDRIADGDGAIILNAGFNTTRERMPVQRAEFTVRQGDKSGSAQLRRLAVKGATAYIWQYCKDPVPMDESAWITANTTAQSTAIISGLTPLTRYWFRVAAVTRQGTSDFTGPLLLAIV